MASTRRLVGEAFAVAIGCLLASMVYLSAGPARLQGQLMPDRGDPLFNLYILRWVSHQFSIGLPGLWDANFYFPALGTLALSDHLMGPALIFLALERLGATPALGYNLLLLLSFGVGAAAMHTVARRTGFSGIASTLAAFAYVFSLFRWHELSHFQVLFVPWLPWTLWTFDRLLESPRFRRAIVFLVCYSLQVSAGSYVAYLLHFGLLMIFLSRLWSTERDRFTWSASKVLVPTALFCLLLGAAVFVPYVVLRDDLRVTTPISWLEPFRLSGLSLISTGPRTLYADLLPGWARLVEPLWIGLLPAALIAIGLAPRLRRLVVSVANLPAKAKALLVLAAVATLVALAGADFVTLNLDLQPLGERKVSLRVYKTGGTLLLLSGLLVASVAYRHRLRLSPDGVWPRAMAWTVAAAAFAAHPVGYFLLMEALPGFGSIRVPARLFTIAAPALCLGMAAGVDRLQERFASARTAQVAAFSVLALLAVEMTPRQRFTEWAPIAAPVDFPAYAKWFEREPSVRAIVELPFLGDWREAERMYLSTRHWRPLVNGYSGYYPPLQVALKARLGDFPDRDTVHWLSELGVTHLVVHVDQLRRRDRKTGFEWHQAITNGSSPWLRHVFEDQTANIYTIVQQGAPDS